LRKRAHADDRGLHAIRHLLHAFERLSVALVLRGDLLARGDREQENESEMPGAEHEDQREERDLAPPAGGSSADHRRPAALNASAKIRIT
jgi:hypothetical protein